MASFICEKDSEFGTQAVVVELSEDPDVNGRVVGWTTGPDALDKAQEAADYISAHDCHPPEEVAELLGYTRKVAL
jgi:hypothetical protein